MQQLFSGNDTAAAAGRAFCNLVHDLLLFRFAERRHVNVGEDELGFPLPGLHRDKRVIVHFGGALFAAHFSAFVRTGRNRQRRNAQ
jgi:hypothetical protein